MNFFPVRTSKLLPGKSLSVYDSILCLVFRQPPPLNLIYLLNPMKWHDLQSWAHRKPCRRLLAHSSCPHSHPPADNASWHGALIMSVYVDARRRKGRNKIITIRRQPVRACMHICIYTINIYICCTFLNHRRGAAGHCDHNDRENRLSSEKHPEVLSARSEFKGFDLPTHTQLKKLVFIYTAWRRA